MTPHERKEIYRRLDNLNNGMIRILGILENDDSIGEDGLVKKVKNISHDLSELLIREQVYKAKATTWGVIGGAIGSGVVWIIKVIATKIFI